MFEKAYRRALERDAKATSLTIEDVIGPPPRRDCVLDLGAAHDELAGMIGLDNATQSIANIVTLAQTNYVCELKG